MKINFQNIEEHFFLDKKVQELLPEFRQQFDSWRLSQMVPGLRPLGQKSLFEVLNNLETSHLEKLSIYFNQPVTIERLNNRIVEHYNFTTDEHDNLCKYTEFMEFCLTFNKDGLSATFWR
jgi:hypothetical protein